MNAERLYAEPVEVGRTIAGRYVLSALLGRGGMGAVFKATDSFLRREVAIKTLLSPDARELDVERAIEEARAAAMLRHPNVITIFDAGISDGAPFLVLEYLEGETLSGRIGRMDASLATRLGWLRDVARGLSAAHRVGIVHRDVKPDNVFLCSDGFTSRVVCLRRIASGSSIAT
jgi:serine/threonine protein kinase